MTNRHHYLAAGLLITFAVMWRIVNWQLMLAPNLEVITSATFIAAIWLPRRFALIVPLVTLAISDAVIGNSSILFFTWSAWAVIGAGSLLLKRLGKRPRNILIASFGSALVSSLFFYAYTNFGVWLITDLYPHTVTGLINSYLMGIPFYRTMLIGNLILVPLSVTGILLAKSATKHPSTSPARP